VPLLVLTLAFALHAQCDSTCACQWLMALYACIAVRHYCSLSSKWFNAWNSQHQVQIRVGVARRCECTSMSSAHNPV